MTHAKLIMIFGLTYAYLLPPWWLGLMIGMLVSFTGCLVVDFISWAVKKWIRDDHK